MKKHIIPILSLALVATFAGLVLSAGPEKKDPQPNDMFKVTLSDDSILICKLKLEKLPIKTSFAELSLPVKGLEKLTAGKESGHIDLVFLNGDRLRGKCLVESIEAIWILGELTIPTAKVKEITTMLKRAPTYNDSPAARSRCINNLRLLDAGKEQWAMAQNMRDGDAVDIPGVNEYIKGNTTPICPAGGKYTYGTIGQDPKCSVPGHAFKW